MYNVDVSFRREKQCIKRDVKKSCQRACGECCGDNVSHTFNVLGDDGTEITVNCEWLSQSRDRQLTYCPLKSLSCPYSCGECESSPPIPGGNETLSSTSHPSSQTSSSPSSLPSSQPSALIVGGVDNTLGTNRQGNSPKLEYVIPFSALGGCLLIFALALFARTRRQRKQREAKLKEVDSNKGVFDFANNIFCGVWSTPGNDNSADSSEAAKGSKVGAALAAASNSVSKVFTSISSTLCDCPQASSGIDDTSVVMVDDVDVLPPRTISYENIQEIDEEGIQFSDE